MAGIIGILFGAICIFGGFVIGEAIAGLLGIILGIFGVILTLVTAITAAFFPKFGYARYAIRKPQKAYDDAFAATTIPWDLEGDLMNDAINIALEPIKIKKRHYARMTFEKLAEFHYPKSAAMIGKFYKEGYGCFRNYKKAAYWLHQTIDDGDTYYCPCIWDARTGKTCRSPKYETDPYSDLAELYLYGQGVPKDENKALELLSKARYKGNEERFFYVKRAKELQRKNKSK